MRQRPESEAGRSAQFMTYDHDDHDHDDHDHDDHDHDDHDDHDHDHDDHDHDEHGHDHDLPATVEAAIAQLKKVTNQVRKQLTAVKQKG